MAVSERRAVVTGVGVVAPGGVGQKDFWDLLAAGRSATRTISLFDPTGFRSRVAAECDFDPVAWGFTPREIRRMDRATQLAIVAAREALGDSGLTAEGVPPERTGVVLGSAVGCTMGLEQEYLVLSDSGRHWLLEPAYAVPHLYGHLMPSTIVGEVAQVCRAEGPVTLISTGCTSGLDSVGHAARLIEDGAADAVITGATDAPISPITVACFDAIKATTPRNDDPGHASRPFDNTRDGFVLGEGAAVFVLEELELARRRGAHIYGRIAGYASRSNAYHMTGLKPDGREMAEAIRRAMRQARVGAEAIGYVNAHGSGTRQNDRHETAAFKDALGRVAYQVPVSSIKSMVGHSLGSIGSIEILACLLALRNQVVPPTANLHQADPECDLDYVPVNAREHRFDTVLSVGSGFGGFQSAMIITGPDRVAA
jgi:act minimal PKS ketosynthase (KS/KS alpha)